MKKIAESRLAEMAMYGLDSPDGWTPDEISALIEEVLTYRKGSLIARGYQINRLQNDLYKQRQRSAGLARQRDLLLRNFQGDPGVFFDAVQDSDSLGYAESAKSLYEMAANREAAKTKATV